MSATEVVRVKQTDPEYLKAMVNSFSNWTGIEEEELKEAIKDVSGDLWSEIRKFQAHVCTEIEHRQQTKGQEELTDEFKEYVKQKIAEMWRDINEHQKLGMDKLGIIVARHISINKISQDKDGKEKKES